MKDNVLVSIIMSVYNAEIYLRESIESILNQSYSNFEFIIIDDGSTDESLEIIKSYKDSRIIIIENTKNSGLIYSLNLGISAAKGKYICRMDADDISLINRIELQYDYLEQNRDVFMISGLANLIDKDNKKLGKTIIDIDLPVSWLLLWENPILHPTVMFRNEDTFKMQYDIDSLHSEDYQLWTKTALVKKIIILNKVLIEYRVLDTSVFRKYRVVSCENSIKANANYWRQSKSSSKHFKKVILLFLSFSNDDIEKFPISDLIKVRLFMTTTLKKYVIEFNEFEKISLLKDDIKRRKINIYGTFKSKVLILVFLYFLIFMNFDSYILLFILMKRVFKKIGITLK